jgi:tetratricopeptide (TPR) repeat protein
MHRLTVSTFISCFLLSNGPVAAQDNSPQQPLTTDKEARDRDARKACLSGDYEKGVAILSEFFLDTKDAACIFNQGRCYEQNERYKEAIGRFREYLRINGKDTALAQKHIAECEVMLQKHTPVAVDPPIAQPTPIAEPMLSPEAQVRSVAEAEQEPHFSTAQSGSGLRMAGLIVASVGAASLVAGLALNLKANSIASSISPPNTYQRSTESERKRYQTLASAMASALLVSPPASFFTV